VQRAASRIGAKESMFTSRSSGRSDKRSAAMVARNFLQI
jgi:hypothetical protein